MKLHFWGAAGSTTGSHHLVENDGVIVGFDCGMFQGRRKDFFDRNQEFAIPPSQVEALLLSHAHIDHIGNVPPFVKNGFEGNIYCTHATADLCNPLLRDSGHIQEKDIVFVNKKRKRKGEPAISPLYTMDDAINSLNQLVGVGYYRWIDIADGMAAKFLEAGHILGSAQIELDVEVGKPKAHRVVFSGDLGRGRRTILRDPEIPSDTDTLIMESTYGARKSPPVDNLQEELESLVNRVADRNGKIIIPAFSVDRTQGIVYQLNVLFNEGRIPRIPIFVDSPLSVNVTEVFRNHPECFNRKTRELLLSDDDVFGFETLTYIRNVQESIALNDMHEPCIIISSSGMCEAGRILHHLRNSIENPANCVLIVGYQAENTLGRRIADKTPKVRIFGEEHSLNAEVVVLSGFSAHADQSELRDYAFKVYDRSGGDLKRIVLVHGEDEGRQALASYFKETLKGVDIIMPNRGDVLEIP
jgi:metallo-beta-lactamase family protein